MKYLLHNVMTAHDTAIATKKTACRGYDLRDATRVDIAVVHNLLYSVCVSEERKGISTETTQIKKLRTIGVLGTINS